MSKKEKKSSVLGTLGSWIKRAVFGGGNAHAMETDINKVEDIITPSRQMFNNFMERKLAVFALAVVVGMFLFVFVGPLFMPRYADAYTEVTQKSIPPGFNMMQVPAGLKNNVRDIDAYGPFSVGVDNDGKVYVWGSTKLGTTGIDIGIIPEEVKNDKIAMVAAGIDHIIAISEAGKVYGWGYSYLGQFGEHAPSDTIEPMPDILLNGTVDVSQIEKLECGYQTSLILMKDGTFYLWGNKNACGNLANVAAMEGYDDIVLTLNYAVGVQEGGKSIFTGMRGLFDKVRPDVTGEAVGLSSYLNGRTIVSAVATSNNVCYLLSDNSLCFAGDFETNAKPVPTLAEGEYWVKIEAGSYHYTGMTNLGNLYSWGGNSLGQSDSPASVKGASDFHTGSFQNYAVNEDDKVIEKWGLKGYLFGTDTRGADVFQRLVNGGRMTMTIGAISVIISSIIGILLGCISGYFGGVVDIFLMRVAEIFSAIPFLPFAMILSAVLAQSSMSELSRIAIIMVILGVLSWPGLARLVRGQVLVARENEYVTAAKSMGVKESKIAFKHILPNVISVILVTLTLDFATCMLTESSLSYLGFGVTYPRPTWGNMLNGANNSTIIKNYWWQWFFPALFLAITTICINIVGDTLRDVMDPKSNIEK